MPSLIVSDPETGKSQKIELADDRMSALVGKRIGELFDGAIVNLPGQNIQFTGGTDKDGIPMRTDVHGSVKARIILSGGVGYKPRNKGERKRVVVRGNIISADTTYLNFKIVEKPKSQRKKREKKEPEEKGVKN